MTPKKNREIEMKVICAILLGIIICLISTGCHVADIPFIGWRIDVANQRRIHHERQKQRQIDELKELMEYKENKQPSIREKTESEH